MAENKRVPEEPDKKLRPKRHWLRFSVRGLLLFTFVICCLLGWIGRDLYQYRTERALYFEIEAAGGSGMIMPKGSDPIQFRIVGNDTLTFHQQAITSVMGKHFFHRVFVLQLPPGNVNKLATKLPHFSELAILYVQESSIDNDFIHHLSQVTTLREVVFRGSKFTDANLQQLARLKHLHEISFSECMLNRDVLSQLQALAHLEKLSFDNTSLKDEGVHVLRLIPNLLHLEIGLEELITEDATACLGDFPSLKTIRLTHVPINDESLLGLSKSRTLESLEVIGTEIDFRVSKQGLNHLQNLKSLKELSLAYISLQDEHLESIDRLAGLEKFACNGQHLSDVGLKHLKNLNQLKSISIEGAQPTLEELKRLSTLPKLTEINLGGKLNLTLPEQAYNYGVPYGKSRADFFQRIRGQKNSTFISGFGNINVAHSALPKSLETLPPEFADVINDPFVPVDAKKD